LAIHFAADNVGLSSCIFFWWTPRNFFHFYNSDVSDIQGSWFWCQSKARMRLPILHSNLGPILHRFRDVARFCAPDPTTIPPNFGVFPLHQIALS